MGDGIPMDKIRNLSVRKTILLYLAAALTCTFLLSALVARTAEQVQGWIWWKYADQEEYFELAQGAARFYLIDVPRPSRSEMSQADWHLSELCDFLQTYSVLILSIAGSCAAVLLFYRNKLKVPIRELKKASQKIADDDLDFHVSYENRDEMGQLCREFERMRAQLADNNRNLWRMIEEEKALRSAIAHDIRSPLSVLKGYQEMLIEYLPNETIDTERAVEMLRESMKQIGRMDEFVETMRRMSSLEQREMKSGAVTAKGLRDGLEAEAEILGKASGKRVVFQTGGDEETFMGDEEVILEVTENLLSNALRYAREQVDVLILVSESELKVRVRDDGDGFCENAEEITRPFYQQNIKDSLKHAGLGMYISRLYCEKHKGSLLLENQKESGAAVTAVFGRIV